MRAALFFMAGIWLLSLTPAPHNMDPFHWLLGKWENTATKSIEEWAMVNDTACNGLGYIPNDEGEIVPDEIMRILAREDGYYFVVLVNHQNHGEPVYFKITSVSASGFTAVNTEHDFPQHIVYQLKGKHLTAQLSGAEQGKKKNVRLRFSRLP